MYFLKDVIHSIGPARWLALPLLLTSLIGPAALGQDGKVIDEALVTLDAESVRLMESRRPTIRQELDQVEVKKITYLSDGLKIKGYLVTPRTGTKLPCVIYNRGGSREFGALTDRAAVGILSRIASWGYIVVATQYRGNAGGEGVEEYGGKDINDVLNLFPLLESLPRADTSRVGMVGWSRGGLMTYLALTKTDRIAAAVVGSGLSDAADIANRRAEMERVFSEQIPDYAKDRDTALAARSPVRWPEKLCKKTPILVIHGGADVKVHPTQGLNMATRLFENKHPFRFVFFEGGDHGVTEHRTEADRLVRDWLDFYVRDEKPWPSLEPHGR